MTANFRVVVDEACPPGKVFICDPSVLGLDDEGKLYIFNPDNREMAVRVEDLLTERAEMDKRLEWLHDRFMLITEGVDPEQPISGGSHHG